MSPRLCSSPRWSGVARPADVVGLRRMSGMALAAGRSLQPPFGPGAATLRAARGDHAGPGGRPGGVGGYGLPARAGRRRDAGRSSPGADRPAPSTATPNSDQEVGRGLTCATFLVVFVHYEQAIQDTSRLISDTRRRRGHRSSSVCIRPRWASTTIVTNPAGQHPGLCSGIAAQRPGGPSDIPTSPAHRRPEAGGTRAAPPAADAPRRR